MNLLTILFPWGRIAELERDARWDSKTVADFNERVHDLLEEVAEVRAVSDRQAQTIRSLHALKDEVPILRAERDRALAEIATLRSQIAPFDHDGDGKPGGSKRKLTPTEELFSKTPGPSPIRIDRANPKGKSNG